MRANKEHPCPGCGEMHRIPPTELCAHCKIDLEYGQKSREQIRANREQGELTQTAIGRDFLYAAPGRSEKNGVFAKDDELNSYGMMKALHSLINPPLTVKNQNMNGNGETLYYKYKYSNSPEWAWLLTPRQFDAVKYILDFILLHSTFKYRDGFNDGRSLIRGLADGTKSIDDYNKITAKLEEK